MEWVEGRSPPAQASSVSEQDETDAGQVSLDRMVPRVSPIGIFEPGENTSASARSYPRSLRLAALVVVGVFVAVVVVSTSLSLGAYCLTTDAGSPASGVAARPR